MYGGGTLSELESGLSSSPTWPIRHSGNITLVASNLFWLLNHRRLKTVQRLFEVKGTQDD